MKGLRKMIRFSYYKNVVNLKDVRKFYSISVGNGGYRFKKIEAFVPDWRLVKDYKEGRISWKEYDAFYYMDLVERLRGKEEIVKDWCNKNDGVCLLCFEKDSKHCHRSIVKEYLKSLGVECEEA